MKALILILLSATAGAQETLSYTAQTLAYTLIGPPSVNDPNIKMPENLSGSLTLAGPLGANWTDQVVSPTSFDFAIFNSVDVATVPFNFATFAFSTDANANITGWNVMFSSAQDVGARASSSQQAILNVLGDQYQATSNNGNCDQPNSTGCYTLLGTAGPGKWTVSAPEIDPRGVVGAMLFLGFGLAVLCGRRRVEPLC